MDRNSRGEKESRGSQIVKREQKSQEGKNSRKEEKESRGRKVYRRGERVEKQKKSR